MASIVHMEMRLNSLDMVPIEVVSGRSASNTGSWYWKHAFFISTQFMFGKNVAATMVLCFRAGISASSLSCHFALLCIYLRNNTQPEIA